MQRVIALVLALWVLAFGALWSFLQLTSPPATAERVVVAALPPSPPAALPARVPDSPPVFQEGPDELPAQVPGVSTEPLPGMVLDVHRAGGLTVFVPRFEGTRDDPLEAVPLDRHDEPDLGDNHPSASDKRSSRGVKAEAVLVKRSTAEPVRIPPIAEVEAVPIPPVEHRWQTLLARMRSDGITWQARAHGWAAP